MEFKGTKGKWVYTQSQFKDYVKVNSDNYIDKNEPILYTVNAENNNEVWEEIRANALLISKAPEMLEMLKEVLKENHCTPDLDKKIEQLIKEITGI